MSTSTDSSCGCGISYHTDGWIAAAGKSRDSGSGDEAGEAARLSEQEAEQSTNESAETQGRQMPKGAHGYLNAQRGAGK